LNVFGQKSRDFFLVQAADLTSYWVEALANSMPAFLIIGQSYAAKD
jgi:hypothetical protein